MRVAKVVVPGERLFAGLLKFSLTAGVIPFLLMLLRQIAAGVDSQLRVADEDERGFGGIQIARVRQDMGQIGVRFLLHCGIGDRACIVNGLLPPPRR